MMKFKSNRTKKIAAQEFATSALPDIVFMLLFFFMVTTVMREDNPSVLVERPLAYLVDKIDQRDKCATLYIGYIEGSNVPQIEFDDRLISLDQVADAIAEKRAQLPEEATPLFTTILKAHKDLPMELITEIKQELRSVNALKIQYSVLEE